uniref:Protein tyrosine phosphatase receptor type Na n=1 Tax=Mastacembelus armatus TaxID=205130 RepID=A0A7N9AV67_9TELE
MFVFLCLCVCVYVCVIIPDGLFGQCRSSKQDQVQYQVSVPVLKRMQEVLKQLMQQGLSWQDDITQYILSKELKRVPQIQLLKTETESNKPQKPGPVSGPPDGPPVSSSSASVSTTPSAKSASLPHSASQPPRAAPAEAEQGSKEQRPPLVESTGAKEEYGYIVTNQSVVGPALTFRIRQNEHNMTAAQVAAKAGEVQKSKHQTGLKIVQTGVGERTDARGLPQVARVSQGSNGTVITLVSMAVVGGVLVLAMAVACFKHYAQQVANGKLGLGPEGGAETHFDYQDCMVGVSDTSRVSSVSSQFSDGPQHSPSSTHSSTPSWSEEPAQSNMDISTGHMILAYMEDHLRNKDRLQKEWEALCSYQAEPSSVAVAQTPSNMDKNRHAESLPYDHSRVKLKTEANPNKQDYINASIIFDHDPRQPAYIATQGPLPHTVTDFWQMVWENGCTVIVMMTALVEDGEKQCERYWPDEGSSLYHIYEVNLVSEHIWCKDFLVRSFYLKNVQTQETRTLTQFHLLSWPAEGIPTSTRPLLDFRRKVNKCYRGRSCPIIVHCSDGTGRAGTYILIDMVLNRMAKGVKEIDIAATLEHIRDQRPGLVRTKDQFEFALTAVAEEVNAILKALPQ